MLQKRKLSGASEGDRRSIHFEDRSCATKNTDESQEEQIDIRATSISEQNMTNSILFRLPRELRDQIYAYVFDDLVLHPIKAKSGHGYRFVTCQWAHSLDTLYDESLQGASAENDHCWKSARLRSMRTWNHDECQLDGSVAQFQSPLVCKQFWAEAEGLYWKHTVFFFDDSLMACFWSASSQLVPKIQRFAILIHVGWLTDCIWTAQSQLLAREVLDRYSSLKGINLVLSRRWGQDRLPSGQMRTLRSRPYHRAIPLYTWLRAFRGRGLKEELTNVLVVVNRWAYNGHVDREANPDGKDTPVEDRLRLAMNARDILLSR